jgi:hypothetical protein
MSSSEGIITYLILGVTIINSFMHLISQIQMNHYRSSCCEGKCCMMEDLFMTHKPPDPGPVNTVSEDKQK